MIHFTFDDNNTSDLWAAGMLKRYGLLGVFFLNDKPGLAQDIEALLDLGMIVGNHTKNHTALNEMSNEQIAEDIVYFNQKLKSYGASGEYFSYPFSRGQYNDPMIHSCFKYIYRGYETEEPDRDGEISRVSVTNRPWETVLSYTKPLQLHGIETGQWTDITRQQFIDLCEKRSQSIM